MQIYDGARTELSERNYFLCYQLLLAAGQIEAAQAALRSAYYLLMARAVKITDPTLCQIFLERIKLNREIIAEYEKNDRLLIRTQF